MPELKVEEAKKELKGIVDNAKESAMTDEQKATQAEAKKKEQEAKAQAEAQKVKDEAVLAKKEEERTAEEKERAKALLDEKQKAEEQRKVEEDAKLSADEKIKRVKEDVQKRIDEVLNESKQIKDKFSKEAQDLQAELKILRQENEDLNKRLSQPAAKDTAAALIIRKEKERIAKHLEEDASKPLEERREMSQEDWDEWFLEHPRQATAWESRQEIRRTQERQADAQGLRRDGEIKTLLEKQEISKQRAMARHPELAQAETRREALEKQGKTPAEIRQTIETEFPKSKLVMEILAENPDKYMTTENGPELLVSEMEKRLGKQTSTTQTDEQKEVADLRKMVEDQAAIIEELRNPPDNGINSVIQRSRETKEQLSVQEKELEDTMRTAGAPETSIKSALEKWRKKKGIIK